MGSSQQCLGQDMPLLWNPKMEQKFLIHLGFDTVKRGGKGFYMKVEAGQKVKKRRAHL